jgi:nucleotide-binding universal stress UspA family protein
MEEAMISLKNILVATDFGEASDAALTYGRGLARAFGATLHVLHVTEAVAFTAYGAESYMSMAPDMQREIENAARARLHGLLLDSDNSGLPTISALRTSNTPALSIVSAKEKDIDLIVWHARP